WYTWHEDRFDLWDQTRRAPCLSSQAGRWECYNDPGVQHTPEGAVSREQLGDYCASLLTYLLAHPEDTAIVAKGWDFPPTAEQGLFFEGLRFKERKRQWFSRSHRKVSTADSKRHDRRWEEIPSWADGSFGAILRLAQGQDSCLLTKLAYSYDVS